MPSVFHPSVPPYPRTVLEAPLGYYSGDFCSLITLGRGMVSMDCSHCPSSSFSHLAMLCHWSRKLQMRGRVRIDASGVNLAADRVLRPQARSRRDALLSWVTGEPGSHHPAMPAFSALALLWGWAQESAIFLLAWAGILRVGEVLNGLRSDFVLPSDSTAGIGYAFFQIRHPKTRGSAAKHQSARIDPKDVISLLAVFCNWPGDKKLWSLSGSTPRKRFNQLQHSLGVLMILLV